jgi:hypothetical protein
MPAKKAKAGGDKKKAPTKEADSGDKVRTHLV